MRAHGADGATSAAELSGFPVDAADTNPLVADTQRVVSQVGRGFGDRPLGVIFVVGESGRRRGVLCERIHESCED